MSRIVRNLLLLLTLVCVIAFIVFTVQLIVLNRDTDQTAGDSPSPSGPSVGQASEPPEPSETTDGGEQQTGSPDSPPASGEPVDTPNTGKRTPSPAGIRYELRFTPIKELVVYADEDLFTYEQLELSERFTYKGDETVSVDIYLVSLATGAQARAENLLTGIAAGVDAAQQAGETGNIGGSGLEGYRISGTAGNETFEVWVHAIPDDADNMGIALVLHYLTDDDRQRDDLYTILDSLEWITE